MNEIKICCEKLNRKFKIKSLIYFFRKLTFMTEKLIYFSFKLRLLFSKNKLLI